MNPLNIYPVLLSGGKGTRLWPFSTEDYPKQYQNFVGKQSLFEQTFLRLGSMNLQKKLTVVTGKSQKFLCENKLSEYKDFDLLLEPVGRNTAPAIAVAALHIKSISSQKNPAILVLPTDHYIQDEKKLFASLQLAYETSLSGALLTFGVVPTEAHTGYGYIKKGEKISEGSWKVSQFIEKPDLNSANKFSRDSDFFWNSGMFLFQVDSIISELQAYSPNLLELSKQAYDSSVKDDNRYYLDEKLFSSIVSDSIDYAVLEKSKNSSVVSLSSSWSDLGNWKAVSEIQAKDNDNNSFSGKVVSKDSYNCYVKSDNKITTIIGVKGLVVINKEDSLLISQKDSCEKIKEVVVELDNNPQTKALLTPNTVHRPWGYYTDLHKENHCRVKKIVVNPGQKLSLQLHNHRSEHWVVVKGCAQVTCGEKISTLEESQSIFIPLKTKHRLENLTKDTIEIIETQMGSYLEEDDIVRFDDIYGR
jgi:mannose-1-phosphate guanylyltransferase / mannose-6-phosphate isomerase